MGYSSPPHHTRRRIRAVEVRFEATASAHSALSLAQVTSSRHASGIVCPDASDLPAVRSLPYSWRARCECPGRLLLGATSPDLVWPYRKVEVWHCRQLAAQVCHTGDTKLFNWCEFSVTTNPTRCRRFRKCSTKPLAMVTKRWRCVISRERVEAQQVVPQRLCKSLRQCMYWIAFLLFALPEIIHTSAVCADIQWTRSYPLQKNTIQIPLNGTRGYNGQWYFNGIWMVLQWYFGGLRI